MDREAETAEQVKAEIRKMTEHMEAQGMGHSKALQTAKRHVLNAINQIDPARIEQRPEAESQLRMAEHRSRSEIDRDPVEDAGAEFDTAPKPIRRSIRVAPIESDKRIESLRSPFVECLLCRSEEVECDRIDAAPVDAVSRSFERLPIRWQQVDSPCQGGGASTHRSHSERSQIGRASCRERV